MKIVIILPGRGVSGGVRCASIVAEGLLKRGHEVRILCLKQSNAWRDRFRNLRDRLLYPGARDWLVEFSGAVEEFDDLTACRFRDAEIIVGFGMASSGLVTALNGLPNLIIQYLHGTTPWDPNLMNRALSSSVPKIVVASYLKDVVKMFNRDEVIAVVHNGVDCDDYYSSVPTCERNGVGLIYSSHIAKDPETTILVAHKLSELMPNVPIRVFSAHRRPRELCNVLYHRYPTTAVARELYSRSLVWIVSSRAEGFSMPVLEAMACGCTVVATDCGGTRDLIISGQNGFLVPVGDADAIVRQVGVLLNDDTLRNRMCANARETVRQHTWNECIDHLESVFTTTAEAHTKKVVVTTNDI